MQWHYKPSTDRTIDVQTARVGVASGKHSQECRNHWKTLAPESVIGGGENNFIDTGTASGYDTQYGFIGGGQNNTICAGACHSSIVGGTLNCVSGKCSVILGGCNNDDGGLPFTGMFGCNLTANTIGCLLWANNLAVPQIPMGSCPGGSLTPPPSLPNGALWYFPDGTGIKHVYVM